MAERSFYANNSRAQQLLKAFNHSFDGDAHKRGLSERQLFQETKARINKLNRPYTMEDVFHACLKAEGVHNKLLPPPAAKRANDTVDRLLGYFLEDSQ
jgi:hypothetical protein